MKVICLSGESGVGKDSVYESYKWISGEEIPRYGFGDILKQVCCKIFDWDLNQIDKQEYKEGFEGWACEKYNLQRRGIIQKFAENACRQNMDLDIWVDPVIEELKLDAKFEEIVFVTDLRHTNEYEALIKNFDCYLFEVVSNNYTTTKHNKHISEQQWRQFPFNAIINNDRLLSRETNAKNIFKCINETINL